LYDEFKRSCDIIGVRDLVSTDAGDQRFDAVPLVELVSALEEEIGLPDLVYLHSPADLNLDHQLAGRAALTAFRPTGRHMPTLLAFETISSSEWSPEPFAPNWFVELTPELLDRKIDALDCYPGELRPQPHPRNGRAICVQAEVRGMQAGVEWAEAFKVMRHVV
jgi:LmbE family N-acetylglucosaminyl deacetylase